MFTLLLSSHSRGFDAIGVSWIVLAFSHIVFTGKYRNITNFYS